MSLSSKTNHCRCCLDDRQLNDLWQDYLVGGKRENYGRMLTECFGLQGPHWEESEGSGLMICDDCISRLRDSYEFKQKILETDELLSKMMDIDADDVEIKSEPGSTIIIIEEDVQNIKAEDDNTDCIDKDKGKILTVEYDKTNPADYLEYEDNTDEDPDYMMEEEYLEDIDYTDKEEVTCGGRTKRKRQRKTQPKQLQKMEPKEQTSDSDKPTSVQEWRKLQADKSRQFYAEIKTVLTYTNGTPFKKLKGFGYQCMYCPEQLSWNNLRTHVRTEHAMERVELTSFMNPTFMYPVLALDIKDLQCTVCVTSIPSWNDMFTHLQDVHDVELDYAYTRIIPYQIEEELHCALCKEEFRNYPLLDFHMNRHYNNYICSTCGDSFLSEHRLAKHMLHHEKGKYQCDQCAKVFTLPRYLHKHIKYVHYKLKPMLKCTYCNEKFVGEGGMRSHLTEHHKNVKKHACNLCPKVFELRTSYTKHMRVSHGNKEKKFKCDLCNKKYFAAYELRNHKDWHRDADTLVCGWCKTKFCSKYYLQTHQLKCSGVQGAGEQGSSGQEPVKKDTPSKKPKASKV